MGGILFSHIWTPILIAYKNLLLLYGASKLKRIKMKLMLFLLLIFQINHRKDLTGTYQRQELTVIAELEDGRWLAENTFHR